MLTYMRDRLFWTVFVIIGITLLTFVITHLIPADPARAAAGLQAREEQVEEMRRRMGLDRPLHEQYIRYITGLVRGDWGTSPLSQRPVLEEIGIYLPATVELVLASMFMALLVGIPMGILAALRQGSVLDRVLQTIAVGGGALPRFWLALMMQVVFFLFLRWFPAGGRFSLMDARPERISGLYLIDTLLTGNWSGLRTAARYLFLPALTLSVAQLANRYALQERVLSMNCVRSTCGQDALRDCQNVLLSIATYSRMLRFQLSRSQGYRLAGSSRVQCS